MAQQSGKKKADLKVVLIGAADVGKTCLVMRYIEDSFNKNTENTIGASFFLKQWGPYNVAIWDTAGEERFSGLSNFYCRDAGAAIMTYDITSHSSFEDLRSRFLPLLPENCLKLVVGAKLDLVTDDNARGVTKQEARQFAVEINKEYLDEQGDIQLPFFETSSKLGDSVTESFEYIFEKCLSTLSDNYRIKSSKGTIALHNDGKAVGDAQSNSVRRKNCCASSF